MTKASERAYKTIRTMILSGDLSAGDAVGEEALAQHCGVSRTPVRDALRRLETETLIRRTSSQRSFVADWSNDEVADAFELRAMLEGYAARRAAERMTDDLLAQLSEFNAVIGKAINADEPDIGTFLEQNRQFHALILETASSSKLSNLLTTLIERPIVRRTAHRYSPEAFKKSHSEHSDLLSAFARRDGSWAEAVMSGHVRRAFHAYSDAHNDISEQNKGAA